MFTPAALASNAEPYKRFLAILLRPTCVSVAVSNQYQSLAEPAGAILLQNGKVPERALSRIFAKHADELTAVVWGSETPVKLEDVVKQPAAAATYARVQDILSQVRPNLPSTWWHHWDSSVPPSCQILPPGGPSAAAAAADSAVANPVGQKAHVASKSDVHRQDHETRSSSSVLGSSVGLQVAAKSSSVTGVAGGAPKAPVCSMGAAFLQHYLDSLGSQNTFG